MFEEAERGSGTELSPRGGDLRKILKRLGITEKRRCGGTLSEQGLVCLRVVWGTNFLVRKYTTSWRLRSSQTERDPCSEIWLVISSLFEMSSEHFQFFRLISKSYFLES